MIEASTHTPTFPSIFKGLYLHNVWCLHQYQSNSDGNIKAVHVGHGKSHCKAGISIFLLGLGLEAQDLFIYSWVSWEELVVTLCQLNRIVIQSSLEPVYLNDLLRCKLTAKELCFIITKPLARGRYVLRSHFMQHELIKVWFWETTLFLKNINKWSEAHSHLYQ